MMKSNNPGLRLEAFLQVMERLLSPEGCPWDREQTHQSLKRYLIEESYEVYEAIEEESMEKLQDELGDVLLQVVFHSALAERSGSFTLTDVIEGVREKMIRRHPHVFSDTSVDGARDVEIHWEAIKKKEKKETENDTLMDVPKAMDPLYRAEKLQKRAARAGFDWPDQQGAWEKMQEEMAELESALEFQNTKQIQEEMGDVFFSLVNLCRKLEMDPVDALQWTNDKFVARFQWMEQQAKQAEIPLDHLSLEEQDMYWKQAKQVLK